MTTALTANYARLPVAFVRGEGAWLFDEAGRRYLDALSGIAVCGLGHAHPHVARRIAEQASCLVHTSNVYRIPLQERLAERLVRHAGMSRVFFANSGAEANECAIKLARLHGHRRGIERPATVVMTDSFHGRTLATLSATGNARVQQGFEPLVEGFVRVPYGELDALHALAESRRDIAAVLVEPIQGEGGIRIPPPGYLAGLRVLADRAGWLLMVDEVQTGMCRTGRWFGHQHEALQPDVMTLAKGLGNGFPIGACLVAGPAADLLQPGTHGSTFGGGPLACAAAHAVLDVLEEERLDLRAESLGTLLRTGLAEALRDVAAVREVRGRGLMLGVELDRPCAELVPRALSAGLLINVTAQRVLRLLPPLIIDENLVGEMVMRLKSLITEFVAEPARMQSA